MITRCINLDWLECYCLEDPIGYPHDADFFRRAGFRVIEREYGTPVYQEMFTVCGVDDQPLIEIRRNPKSAIGRQGNGVLDVNACHVRLTNRTCYFAQPATIMQLFLERYGLHFQRISRIDVCLDFTQFDYGDNPADVMARYFKHKYTKINQANISAHGADLWDGRIWNSVSWGNQKSMVGTKFYNKTMELREKSDKPYIRQAWRAAGLVDDEFTLTKATTDDAGHTIMVPMNVWRVEFSVKSGTRKWFVMENNNTRKVTKQSVRHTLDMWATREQLLTMFASLQDHYFHFKIYEAAKRKDRCKDKLLFNWHDVAQFYHIENVATREQADPSDARLYRLLQNYTETCIDSNVHRACNVVLAKLEETMRREALNRPWSNQELELIRLLVAKRWSDKTNDAAQDKHEIEQSQLQFHDHF